MNLAGFILASFSLMVQLYVDKYRRDDLQRTLQELENLQTPRLSEKYSVLLLEEGGPPPPASDPQFFHNLIGYDGRTSINNLFVSVPQSNAGLENKGRHITATGKMLGGSGSHNGNVYYRGSPRDFDNYARLTGDASWAYENMLHHFKHVESFRGWLVNEEDRADCYGTSGPIIVTTDTPPVLSAWFEAGNELGYKIRDANAYQEECSICPYGDVLVGRGLTKYVYRIPVKSPLPGVGSNLRDHVAVLLQFTASNPNSTLSPVLRDDEVETEFLKFQGNPRSGYLARMTEGPQAFIVSSQAKAAGEGDWPDLQLGLVQDPVNLFATKFAVILARPESVGEVGFNISAYRRNELDANDVSLAVLDYKYLTNPRDESALLEGISIAFGIMEGTSPFQAMGVKYTGETPEACVNFPQNSVHFWRCYIKQVSRGWLHPVGSCKMGHDSDPMAVVDSKSRVRGIQNLRVVDASILPKLPNTNISPAVIVLAEKFVSELLSGKG